MILNKIRFARVARGFIFGRSATKTLSTFRESEYRALQILAKLDHSVSFVTAETSNVFWMNNEDCN